MRHACICKSCSGAGAIAWYWLLFVVPSACNFMALWRVLRRFCVMSCHVMIRPCHSRRPLCAEPRPWCTLPQLPASPSMVGQQAPRTTPATFLGGTGPVVARSAHMPHVCLMSHESCIYHPSKLARTSVWHRVLWRANHCTGLGAHAPPPALFVQLPYW